MNISYKYNISFFYNKYFFIYSINKKINAPTGVRTQDLRLIRPML